MAVCRNRRHHADLIHDSALFYVNVLLPEGYSMMEVYKGVIPFIIAVLVVTVLVVLIPNLCMWLPNLSCGG